MFFPLAETPLTTMLKVVTPVPPLPLNLLTKHLNVSLSSVPNNGTKAGPNDVV